MPERIAIKVMTGSDLTFFDSFFKKHNIGNQKAINLNADVFAKQFYPDFSARSQGVDIEVPVAVTVFGPRPGNPYRFPRSITKKSAYKNWRLNGAAVPDPDNETGRFDHLEAGDIAVIEFEGDAEPDAVRIVIVSKTDDPTLHDLLQKHVPGGKKSMVSMNRPDLSKLASDAAIPTDHPIQALLEDKELEEILEQASLGAEPAIRKLKERAGRRTTKSDLKKARERAERVGDDGEALAHLLLKDMAAKGELPEIIWTSVEDAAASWDFETNDKTVRFDAKSTTGGFEKAFHLSAAEAKAASSKETPYRIVRVYDLTEDGAQVRISNEINKIAEVIVDVSEKLPRGTLPTGFTIDPNSLTWDEPRRIDRPDEPDDEASPQPQ